MTNALDRYLTENDITSREFAERIGVSQPAMSRLRNCKARITIDMAQRILVATEGELTPNDLIDQEVLRRHLRKP
jgi:plasmid maintenance system antidote protein VapI